jgi:hypothetical protein
VVGKENIRSVRGLIINEIDLHCSAVGQLLVTWDAFFFKIQIKYIYTLQTIEASLKNQYNDSKHTICFNVVHRNNDKESNDYK